MKLSENALAVAKSRYFIDQNEDWSALCTRVATAIASNEEKDVREYWAEKFYNMLFDHKALGGGRILRNAGKPKNKILNCHGLPMEDDILAIGEFVKKALVLSAEGGGIGTSPQLRPKGAVINTKGGNSSGVISFLQAISHVLGTIESGGNRRSGCLPILSVSHPEIIDFINAKRDHDQLNNFNISVGINNAFLDAVEKKEKWDFTFDGEKYGDIWANDLFDMMIENQLASGEPGLVNTDIMKINNSFYFSPISTLNLCGELPLSDLQSCCIGSVILPNFLSVGESRMHWTGLGDTIHTLVRFLDNAIDINHYTFPEMQAATMTCRRIGIGMAGLGDFLFAKQCRYGSEAGLDKTEHLVKFMRNEIYKASIELAKERGSFQGYNQWSYLNAKFVKKLPAKIRLDIKEHGIRNCTGMAFAPTGSISLIADTTSGIEPLPVKAYIRKDKVGDRTYIHPLYREFIEKNEPIPNWFVDSLDLTPEEHFETAVSIQSFNDGSISKTMTLPEDTKPEQLKDWLLEYSRKLIGITVYRDGSRKEQIMESIPEDKVRELIKNEVKTEGSLSEEDVQCHGGSCDF